MDKIKKTSNQNIDGMTEAAWKLAYAGLWPIRTISQNEKEQAQKIIRSILASKENTYSAYQEFCQRLLLYRQYIFMHKEKIFLPSPVRWLQPGNGYSISGILYKTMLAKRMSSPLFKQELKWLAEAVLDIMEEGDGVFAYWEKWLSDRNAKSELRLFYLYTACVHHKL